MNNIIDERPWAESYNMMGFNPGMPIMYPGNSCQQNNNYDNRISKLESEVDNLQNRISRLEGNMYPQAVDYSNFQKTTYQNSMNMM